jgi:protein-tyrosine kinase
MSYAKVEVVMSNVFKALERAEKEKQIQLVPERPLFEILEESSIENRNDGAGLKEQKHEIEQFEFPAQDEDSITIAEKSSFAAEQFRKIKTHIFRMAPKSPRVILVTSTVPQEGKTTVTVNLAVSIARELHKRVILIDADLRNPSVYPTKFENVKGLGDYLSKTIPVSEVMKSLDGNKLIVIPAGTPVNRAAELINSSKMKELIDKLRNDDEGTFILIDSPPILSTSEPLMLSEWVDGVILAVMADHATRGSIKRAFGLVDRQKIIGIVFNNKNLKSSKIYSDYYHSYKYYNKYNK